MNTAVLGIEYNDRTRDLLDTVQRADALLGARGNSNLQASVAAGLQAAGESGEGASGMFGLAMATGMMGVAGLQQQASSNSQTATTAKEEPNSPEDATISFKKLKELFDSELITQSEFEAAKAKLLGL